MDAKTRAAMTSQEPVVAQEDEDTNRRPCGRPHNDHVQYLPAHPKHLVKQRIVQSQGHNNLPNFIGSYFLRRDDPEVYPFYCACMLILLKPWRNVMTDLKSPEQTWESAFEEFSSTASQKIHHILSGIQYFYECEMSAWNKQGSATGHTSSGLEETSREISGELELGEDALPADDAG